MSDKTNSRVFWTNGISISFGGLVAVDTVSIDVRKGEVLGLIGPNGSGKTTIFNIITGIYEADEGDFFLEGTSLRGWQPHKIARKGIARTFQTNRLCLDLSIIDNILIGMHPRQKSFICDSIFRRGKLAEEAHVFREQAIDLLRVFNPELVDLTASPANVLPQIDRRRVEICRAIAMRPKLLLLDEPSAGMTLEEMAELMDDINKIKETMPGISIIIIEHDMTVIKTISDRVVALNYGAKIAEGTFEEVASNELVREAYLGKGRLSNE